MRHFSDWGWILGIVVAAVMSVGLARLSHMSQREAALRYKVPPRSPREFSRGDFDNSVQGLPAGVGGIPLGMRSAELSRTLDTRHIAHNIVPVPGGERWDLDDHEATCPLRGGGLWRVQLDSEGNVVAVAGAWWSLTFTGEPVRPQYISDDFSDPRYPRDIPVDMAMSHAFGPPDSTDNFGIGRVQTWDRLPAALMQVHVPTGITVIARGRNHRLFADE